MTEVIHNNSNSNGHAQGCACPACVQENFFDSDDALYAEYEAYNIPSLPAGTVQHAANCNCGKCYVKRNTTQVGDKHVSKHYSSAPYTSSYGYSSGGASCGEKHDGTDDCFCFLVNNPKKTAFCGSKTSDAEKFVDEYVLYLPMNNSKAISSQASCIKEQTIEEDFSEYDLMGKYDQIVIDCTDYRPPRLKPAFWKRLREIIDEKGYDRVVVSCMGGHGRTGTALACLYLAYYKSSGSDAVRYVKAAYCHKAVEDRTQKKYIKMVAAYFDELEEYKRAKKLTPPKVEKAPEPPKVVTSLAGGKLCAFCGKVDHTCAKSTILGKDYPECTPCYQARKKNVNADSVLPSLAPEYIKARDEQEIPKSTQVAISTKVKTTLVTPSDAPLGEPLCKGCGSTDKDTVKKSFDEKDSTIDFWECDDCFDKRTMSPNYQTKADKLIAAAQGSSIIVVGED